MAEELNPRGIVREGRTVLEAGGAAQGYDVNDLPVGL